MSTAHPSPRPRRVKSSHYRGVFWHRWKRRWQVSITFQCRSIHVGHFIDPVEAAFAYDKRARQLLGCKAICNFPAYPEHQTERYLGNRCPRCEIRCDTHADTCGPVLCDDCAEIMADGGRIRIGRGLEAAGGFLQHGDPLLATCGVMGC